MHTPLTETDFLKSPAWLYEAKWAGWDDPKDNTWQSSYSLRANCQRLVLGFWKHVGEDTFLINFEGFEVQPSEDWIEKEIALFWKDEKPNEQPDEQSDEIIVHDSKRRKLTETLHTPVTPKRSAPSTPRHSGSTQKKVSFARVASVNIIPPLTDAVNTAQSNDYLTKRAYESDDEDEEDDDDIPIAESSKTTPTGLKLRIPRRAPVVLQSLLETPDDPSLEPEPMTETPPASPTSLFSDAPPSPPQTPPHRVSRSIKIIDPHLDSGSKLATKQRLAKASVAPGLPRASPAPDLTPTSSSQPAAAAENNAVDVDPTPTLVPDENTDADGVADINTMFASFTHDDDPAGAGFYGSDEDRYAGLPKNGDALDLGEGFAGNEDHLHEGLGGIDEALNEVPPGEVDEFLNAIELREPMNSDPNDYRPSKPLYEAAPIKPWTWNGRVTITVAGCVETTCENATLAETTEAQPPQIASFVHSTQDLNFDALFDIDDLFMFLPHCQPAHQFARLTAKGPDAESLCIFSQYMAKKTQAIMIPAMMEDQLLGCLLFVPPTAESLLEYLNVPPELCLQEGLIAVLLFCVACSPDPYRKRQIPRVQHRVEPAILSRDKWRRSLEEERAYHIGLRIIQLPTHIREYVYTHRSTVWFKCSSSDEREDQDTRHLLQVLKKSKAGVVPSADMSADVVFIHVGALKNIHNLPHLADRRLCPKLRFCLYGTHETVHHSRWGFREIYLLGGVVTFTPEALADDAWGVLQLIQHIDAHPLWTCYLIPQVLGMAIKLNQLREDEMPEYADTLPYTLERIFGAIRDGQVALMQTPVNDPTDDDVREWVLEHSLFRPLTTQAVLERCTQAFQDAYASFPQENWATLAKNDVLADMRRMQIQPGVLTEYRRFVVLDSSSDGSRYKSADDIECTTLQSFGFNDDFIEAKGDLLMA
ncbi:hypothetical protein B0H19DRAFT_1090548 [Mycena capillaripes]|nr:hypothetical protein B0H19DRAFT_1090548 [Mycena capillaripes]